MLQKISLCANLLNSKNYLPFKIVYCLTLLDLIFLLVDERVRLDSNNNKKKTQLLKALFKKV
jgi:hypothetical protein